MDAINIDLVGSRIAGVQIDGDTVRVRFQPAYLVKTMTGSNERTRWWQDGELIFHGARVEGPLPEFPAECLGGDVTENIYTYRDMVPVPLESRGHAACGLRIADSEVLIRVSAGAVKLEMRDVPKYIEHVRTA